MNVRLEQVTKRFVSRRRDLVAVRDVELAIADGEFFVLLGPSGCGKSTLLNLVAGLERPSSGRILFGDTVVADPAAGVMVDPRQRNVAMVFQNYALYPHLSVFENIAFPLRIARVERAAVEGKVRAAAAKLGLEAMLQARPGELSGGQRQRVAIARAIVREPNVFLLDEPLSNLDAQLRMSTRAELRTLQRELGVTTVYVTHDQVEAMTLGDRVAVVREGRVVQVAPPTALYERPATPFVATFVGSPPMNLLEAVAERSDAGTVLVVAGQRVVIGNGGPEPPTGCGACLAGIRPEALRVDDTGSPCFLEGVVSMVERLGRESLVHVSVGEQRLTVLSSRSGAGEGQRVRLGFDARDIHFYEGPS